ncbi:dentin sialophosphoprotein-like [Phoenix dactylifera]|uniref:Dentin sialophosphoprotein-like n=1 Tax=Phoenix dactylifera TaxID=42345 RepID=A0A8B8J7J7_PHODC|nr:dentin sialophosphoprotein-like [Phoenix dactylifera]
MAKGSPSPPPAAASSFPVFVDSNLDTHLAMVVSPDDTVADLKRKIRIEHALCFPNAGEITIQAIKVKRRSSFYHLSDSMLVRSAFDGIQGTWFLHIDASPASMVKGQAGTVENVVSENVEQAEKHDQLHVEPNVSDLPGCNSDKIQCVVDGKQSLLETSLDRLASHGNSSLPNARSCQIDSMQGSSHDQIDMGDTNVGASKGMNLREKVVSEPDHIPDVTDMHEERTCKVIEEVEPQEQYNTSLVGGQEEKDGGEEGCENPDVGASDGGASIIDTKKEKISKRSKVSGNNLILDVDSEHLSREKKKQKKEKDGSFKESLLEAPATGNNFERPVHDEETSKLENVPPGTNSQEKHLAFFVGLSGKLIQGDSSLPENLTDDKRKKKKRKKSSKYHNEVESAVPSKNGNTSLSHCTEEPHIKIGPSVNSVDITGAVVPVGEQAIEGNAEEVGVNNYKTLTKEPDAAARFEEATENVTEENHEDPLDHSHTEQSVETNVLDGSASLTNPAVVGPEVPTNSFCSRKRSKNELPNNTASRFDPADPSEHVNPYEASGDNCRDLHEESDAATISKKIGDPNKVANLDIEVPSGTNIRSSHHRRKKNTKKAELTNLQPNKNGIAHPSGDQVSAEDYKDTLCDHHRELGKESEGATILREAVALENSPVVDSGTLSNIDDRKSNRRSKKSTKSKLQNHKFIQQESAYSLGKEPVEEKPKETLETSHKDLGKESKATTSHGEPAVLGSPSKVDLVIPSSNNDKISRHRKKKLAKAEHFYSTSSNHDLFSGDQSTRENFEKAFRTTNGESGNTSNAVMLPEDASQNISHGTISKLDSTGWLNDSSNKHETAHHSTKNITQENRKELLGNTDENSVQVNEKMDLSKSGSGKTNFDSFLPKVTKHESVLSAKELPLKEAETGKLQKDKSKRKRKLNMHSQDSIADTVKPLSSNEQHVHKSKYQDADPGNHILIDSMAELPNKEVETKTTHDEKTRERSSKSNMNFGDTSSILRPPQNSHDDSRPEKKLQEYKSDTSHQASLSRDEKRKHVRHPKEKTSASDSKLKSHDHQDGTAIVHSTDEVPHPGKMNAVIKGDAVGAPATQGDSADVACKDAVADLSASSDSTEDTPHRTKRYRVAVRKVPSKRFGKVLNHSKQEKPSLATPGAIFDDDTSESTDDEFVITNREDHMKAISDNSSTSADSDGDLEETQTIGIKPAAFGKKDGGIDDGGIILSQKWTCYRNHLNGQATLFIVEC